MEYRIDNFDDNNENARTVIKGYPGGGNTFGGMDFETKPPKQKKKHNKTDKSRPSAGWIAAIVAICVACAVGGSLLTAFVFMPPYINSRIDSTVAEAMKKEEADSIFGLSDKEDAPSIPDSENGYDNSVEYVAETCIPGVVSVFTYQADHDAFTGSDELNRLEMGSGFIIDESGYIITNYHVLEGADVVKVTTMDGKVYEAEIIGQDFESDIAVLKIDAPNLTVLKLGDSDTCRVGQMVVAIGNPIGENLKGSVTVGYIGSLEREVQADNRTYKVLQMDAAINPGNSGGPLFNLDGEVIGVNTLKSMYAGFDPYGNTISSEGIAFAIPINYVKEIARELIENGSVAKPGIGMTYYDLTADYASKWQVPEGFLVMNVIEDGPADKVGLKENDIITEVDGISVHDENFKLSEYLKEKGIGTEIVLTVWRDKNEAKVSVELVDINSLQ